jgi:hypothetical protein
MKNFHASLQKYFYVIAMTMFLAAARADAVLKTVNIPRSTTPLAVRMDGILDESAWRNAAAVTGFVTPQPSALADPQTSALVMADSNFLYVGFVCNEPHIDKLVHQIKERQGSLWADDCVEFFLDPTSSGAWVYHWIVNPNGALWEGLHATGSGTPQFKSDAISAAHIGTDQWSCELKIPLKSLMTTLQSGQQMKLNFGRERKAGEGNQLSSWSPTEGSFLDPQTLAPARLGAQNGVEILSLGSGSDAYNQSGINQFAAKISAADVPVKAQIFANGKIIAKGRADFPGELKVGYVTPANAALKFEISKGAKVLFTCTLKAPTTTPRVWQIPDPLYKKLLGNGAPASKYKGVLMWAHNVTSTEMLRQTARRFGLQYVLSDMYEQAGREKFRLFGGPPSANSEGGELYKKANVKYVYMLGRGAPWVIDPQAVDKSLQDLDAILTSHGKDLWAISASDEVVHRARVEGADLMENPPKGYAYIKQADSEVRTQFGGGKYGIPHGQKDPNPYRWIAFNKWLVVKFHDRAVRIRQIVAKHHLNIPLVSYDPQSRSDGNDYSGVANDYDIWTHQTYQRANQWTANSGFYTKYLADLTGKDVWPCVHAENYAMATTPEEAREEMAEVFRNGGSGYHFYLPDTANGNKIVGDTRLAYFGSPRRYNTILNVINLTSTMPKLRYPNTRTAILYNDDMLQSTFSGTRVPMYSTEAAYTFLGPVARSWFKFIDDSKVLSSPSLNQQFDTIYLPIATYQRPEIVARLRQFVRNGGTLVCGDANAFDTDTLGNDTSTQRQQIFGVTTGEKTTPKVLSVRLNKKTFALPVVTSAIDLKPESGTQVLGTFEDGSAAITSHQLGKGRAILFASNPFNMDSISDSNWRAFFTTFASYLHDPINLDIWRFQFPDSVLGKDIPTPAGECLTNNHVTWREEKPLTFGNIDLKGKYQLQPAPDAMADVSQDWIAFADGHLTDRRKSMLAEKVKPEWYVGFKLPDSHWMDSWKNTASVMMTYDLQKQVKPAAVQFWFDDTMPKFEVLGSNDQKSWQVLGANSQIIEAGKDIKKITVALKANKTCRYVRVVFAKRNVGQKLSLVESEVWGVVGK